MCVGSLALVGLMTANSGGARHSVHPALQTASSLTASGPMIPAAGVHHSTKAAIGLFVAAPAQLPAGGGKVRLVAVVQGATTCRFSSTALGRLRATKSCALGKASITLTLPRNSGSAARKFRFRLTATGPGSSTTAGPVLVTERAPVSAHSAPKITTEPTGRTVAAGQIVSFAAAASGSPRPSVQWQVSRDGGHSWAAVTGATTGSYSFTAASSDDSSEYRAIFVNSAGRAVSVAATLSITLPGNVSSSAAPVVTTQPASQSVVTGTGVSFTAAASGSPAPSVRWRMSSDGGSTWSTIPGATSTTLAFTTQLSENGRRYEAVFANSAGSATSSAATLTVVATGTPPSVVSQPSGQTVIAGQQVTFTATANGTPTPSVQWMVSADGGGSWQPVATATSTSYTFIASQSQSGHEYEAVFSNGYPPNATTSPVTLTVQTGPQILQQPSPTTVVAGASASFTATATGSPQPTVQWQVLTGGTWVNVGGATSTTYSFPTTSDQNGSQYRAIFSNTAATVPSAAVTLTVTPTAAPVITTQPTGRAVPANSTVSFTAAASGAPAPTVQWMISTDHGGTWSPATGATSTSPTYTFTALGGDNNFEYEAVFSNTFSSTIHTATTNPVTLVVGTDTASQNWSGYVAQGSNFTMVTATWSVPAAICNGTTTFSSMWVGIDGYGSPTVEQDGTDSNCEGPAPGTAHYYAWIEMYGDDADTSLNKGSEVQLANPVSAGDPMSATVSLAAGQWTLAISDLSGGHPWNVSQPVTWNPSSKASPQQLSAEWVVERPELCDANGLNCSLATLTNFGTASFSGAAATKNGTTSSLTALSAFALQMSVTSPFPPSLLALPGQASGGSFSDTFYGSS
jgi:hypothetical protein